MEIEHQGDASDRNSGGPLFLTFRDCMLYAIGVHSDEEYRVILGLTAEDNNVVV